MEQIVNARAQLLIPNEFGRKLNIHVAQIVHCRAQILGIVD